MREIADAQESHSLGPMVSVYVMRQDNRLKIGISSNPERRREQIVSASGLDVELVYSRLFAERRFALDNESALHRQFSAFRLKGEWFSDDCAEHLFEALEIGPTIAKEKELIRDEFSDWYGSIFDQNAGFLQFQRPESIGTVELYSKYRGETSGALPLYDFHHELSFANTWMFEL